MQPLFASARPSRSEQLKIITKKAFIIVTVLWYLQAQAKDTSLMQPLLPSAKSQQPSTAQIGSDAFAALAEADVAPDSQFFHRFYR